MNYLKILDRLDYWIEQSDKWQKAIDGFCETIAPSSYSPIIEDSYAQAFIEGVSGEDRKLKDWLEYYAYEVIRMDSAVIQHEGRQYEAKDKKQFAKFLKIINQ